MDEYERVRNAKIGRLKRQWEEEEEGKEESNHGVGKPNENPKKGSQYMDDFQRILTYCYDARSQLNERLKVFAKKKGNNADNR